MKKLLSFMLTLLFATSTLWAQQVIKTSTAEDPVYYIIASYNRGGYLTNAGVGSGVTHVDLSDAAYWYFEQTDENGGVAFVNKLTTDDGEKIYLGSDKTASTTSATWYILTNGVNNYGMSICSATAISNANNCIDANNHNTEVGGWHPSSGDWEGTTWVFVETDETYNPNGLIFQTRADRYITGVSITGVISAANTTVSRDYTGGKGVVYTNLTETVTMQVVAGETITPSITRKGDWTHAYVYIDKDNDGFTASVAEDGYTPADDLVSFSFYSGDESDDTSGKNSAGTIFTNAARNTIDMPAFTAPTEPGIYRMRFKNDWNSLDPNGGNTNFMSNGGSFVDVMLEVLDLDIVTVQYKFIWGGTQIGETEETIGCIGEEWPNFSTTFPFGVSATKPDGVITDEDVVDGIIVKEITLVDNTPFSYAADYASIEHWYYMSLKDFAHYLYYSEGATQMDLSNAGYVPGDNKDAFTWGFIGDPFNGYQIVNFAAGENMILSSTTTTTDNNTGGSTFPIMTTIPVPDGNNTYWVATASTYRDGVGFYLEQKGYSENKMNLRDNKLAYWNSGADAGSTLVVEERNILAEAIEAIETARLVSFGEGVGQYTNPENVDLEALIAAVELAVNDCDLVGANAATKELYAGIATLAINLPQPGKFYRFQNNAGNAYLVSGTGTGRTQFSDVAENAANSIFYYTGEKLVDYTTGLYLAAGNDSSFLNYTETKGEAAGVAISFVESNSIGKMCVNYNTNRYLYSAGEGDSNGGKTENGIPSDTNYYFSITEVTELPIAYNEEFVWSTLYSPVQLGLIEKKVKAYTGTLNTEDPENVTLVVTELNGSIPANTGVILGVVKSEDIVVNGYVYLPIEETTISDVTSVLKGAFETIEVGVAADEVVESDTEGETVYYYNFVKADETDENGNYYGEFNNYQELHNVAGFSAYLEMSTALTPDETINIADSEGNNPTGIEEITVEAEMVQGIYDLQGRRLSAPVKGINIINGKKVLVK